MKNFFAPLASALGLLAAVNAGAQSAPPAQSASPAATAIFAGGCFWCTEADFEKLPGVIKAESGYTGGQRANPTYEYVTTGRSGHTEAVRVYYDPAKVTYEQLLTHFWRTIDPTVKDRQFCDIGSQYRSGIYPLDAAQKQAAEASKAELLKSGRFKQIHTEIVPAAPFYLAENYHQDYYKKNQVRYNFYRYNCGRDARLREVWGEAQK